MASLDPQVRGQLLTALAITCIFSAMTFAMAWFAIPDGSGRGLIVGLAMFLGWPIGLLVVVGVVVVYSIEGARTARNDYLDRSQRLLARWCVPVAGVVLVLALPAAAALGSTARVGALLRERMPLYQRVIADHHRGVTGGHYLQADGRALQYHAEPSRPLRVYFPLSAMGDNSFGFVYDPTDAVLAAQGWRADQRPTAPDAVRRLFGGDIVWCERVTHHFHRCGLS